MDQADYDSEAMDTEAMEAEEQEGYDQAEVNEMLDALIEEADMDLAERQSRRGGQRQGVRTATGRTPYRAPVQSGVVTQKQFQESMTRIGEEMKRNAEGIKTVNARVGKLDGRVDGVVAVNKVQSRKIGGLDTRMKLDSALDFASSVSTTAAGLTLDLTQVFRGVVKNGALGDGKGALSNPWVIGGIALVLRNPSIIGGLLTPPARTP